MTNSLTRSTHIEWPTHKRKQAERKRNKIKGLHIYPNTERATHVHKTTKK